MKTRSMPRFRRAFPATAALLALLFSTAACAAEGPHGMFVLNDDNPRRTHPYDGPVPLAERAFTDDLLTGISIREGWADIERQEGSFNWSLFDSEIARAKRAGKKVIIRVYTNASGTETPDWLYQAGAQKFTGPAFVGNGSRQNVALPVPWDPVFQSKWTDLIRAMGQKYDREPTVVLVQMDSADYTGGEMHLPKSPAAKQQWMGIGYSKDRLVSAWRRVIDVYNQAFPDKPLALDIALPVFNDGTVEDVVAYMKSTLGSRCAVQHNALAANTQEQGFPHVWVTEARGCIIGFQQLVPWTPEGPWNGYGARYGGPFEAGLAIGARAGMQYLEIYPRDIFNLELRPIIQKYDAGMK